MQVLSFLAITSLIYLCEASTGVIVCGPRGFACLDPYRYQMCMEIQDISVLIGPPETCPDGYICDILGFFPCKIGQVTTTTLEPTPAFKCSGEGKFPASQCSQYYECKYVWFKFTPYLMNCPSGQAFDPIKKECASAEVVGCLEPTSTSPVPSTAPSSSTQSGITTSEAPICNGPAKYPTKIKNQYLECELIWFRWVLNVKTCPDGDVFDEKLQECAVLA